MEDFTKEISEIMKLIRDMENDNIIEDRLISLTAKAYQHGFSEAMEIADMETRRGER